MPNPLIKKISAHAGVKKSEVEHTWEKLAKEYGKTNYEAIVGTLKKIYKYEGTAEDSNREKTEFGHLKIDNCVLTSESVDAYKGSELPAFLELDPEKIYNVYRPIEELKKAIKSYNDVPLTNEHFFVDNLVTNKDKWLGSVGSKATIKNGQVINSVNIWDKSGVELVERIKKEGLSCGYKYNIVDKKGVWNGKPYDFMMTDIVCNHVALVGIPRNKPAKLADSDNFNKEDLEMDAQALLVKLLTKNPHLLMDSEEGKGENKPEKEEKQEDKKSKKKGKDMDIYYHSKKGKDAEEEAEEENEHMKDKKKGKDKKCKDKDPDAELKAEDTAKLIQDSVNNAVIAHIKTKELCEKVIGKSAFGADAMPEEMINKTLKAKNIAVDGYSLETKTALLQYIADTQVKQTKTVKHTFASDSTNKCDYSIIEI